ncbi:MAG TPA: ATP-binding protein, partial [Chloroflexota bacterium]|nr:ATP-binding protein [Chloroflexota bacterium]
LALLLVLLLCAAGLAAVLAETYDHQLQAVAQDRLQRDLPLVHSELEEFRLRDLHLAEIMANNPDLVSATATRDGGALDKVLGPLHAEAAPAVQTVAVVDPNGQIVAMDPFSDLNLAGDAPVKLALGGTRDVNVGTTKNVVYWVRTGSPPLAIESAWPVRFGSDTIGAVVTLNVLSDATFELVLNPAHLAGAVVAPQQRSFLAGNIQLRQLNQQQKLTGFFDNPGQKNAFYRQAVVGGEPYYFVAEPFPTQPAATRLLLGVSGKELASAADSLRRQLAAVALIAFLVLAAVGWLVLQWLLRPVRQLRRGALEIGDPVGTFELSKSAPPEVREVASALSGLAAELAATLEAERGQRSHVEAIIDSMAEGVVVSDVNRRVTLVNPIAKRLLGINGAPNGAELPGDLIALSPNSNVIKSRSAPIIGEDGRTTGYVTLLQDASEEAELDRLKSEFVGIVSHELRTPLTSIKGSVDLLLDAGTGDLNPTQRRFLSTIRRSSDRLINLVNDLLDLSRLEAGRVQLDSHPVDAQHLVEDAVSNLGNLFAAKKQRVQVSCQPGLPPILADRQRMEQVLVNLLGNAIKYTPEGGEVCVAARRDDGFVEIAVSDTGPGLTPSDQQRVFDKFYRAGETLTQQQAGSGLGLTIARSLVELHGGTLTVESELGQGATFRTRMPSHEEEE